MKTKKTKRLAVTLTTFILTVTFLALAVLTIIIAFSTSQTLIEQQQGRLALMSSNNALIMKSFVENVVNKQSALAVSIKNVQTADKETQMRLLTSLIDGVEAEEPNMISLYYVKPPDVDNPSGLTVSDSSGSSPKYSYSNTAVITAEQYKAISESKTLSILDPFKKTIDGKEYLVVSVLYPILDDNGKFLGILGSDIDTDTMNSIDYSDGGYESFYNLIICGHQTVIINTANPSAIGTKYVDSAKSTNPDLILNTAKTATAQNFLDSSTDGTQSYRACSPFYIGGSKTVWISTTSVDSAEFNAPIIKQLTVVISVSFIALLVLALLTYATIRRSLLPLKEIDEAAKSLAAGNLNINLVRKRNDEIGNLAENLTISTRILSQYINDIDRAMDLMAGGDFNVQPSQPFIGDFENIEHSITNFILRMCDTLGQINEASRQVSMGADQTSQSANLLSDGASRQASSIEELSATISEISQQISANASNATEAKIISGKAGDNLMESNRQMANMIEAMNEISGKSDEIKKIIKTIEDIAFQTNILALNAAVEAARAGSAGKGFAVVADEVRNLASKSAEAANNTTLLIEETLGAVANGTKIANDTAKSLVVVIENAQKSIEYISKIEIASTEQAEASKQINFAIGEIADVVQNNTATSEESAAASDHLSSQARLLKNLIDKFKLIDLSAID